MSTGTRKRGPAQPGADPTTTPPAAGDLFPDPDEPAAGGETAAAPPDTQATPRTEPPETESEPETETDDDDGDDTDEYGDEGEDEDEEDEEDEDDGDEMRVASGVPDGLPDGVVWHGNPRLIPFLVRLDSLREDPENAKLHPEDSIRSIAGSYQRFGQQKPIVCGQDMVVRDGNGQYRAAASRLGWTHIAAIPSDLDGVELSAYALAVNRTAEHAPWDDEALGRVLRSIEGAGAPVDDLGWSDEQLAELLKEPGPPPLLSVEYDGAASAAFAAGSQFGRNYEVAIALDEKTANDPAFKRALAEVCVPRGLEYKVRVSR